MTAYKLNLLHQQRMERVGETIKGLVSTPGVRGDLYRFNDPDGTWYPASHISEATSKGMLGILISSNEFLLKGIFKTTGLSKAATYFIGEPFGTYSATEPTKEDYIRRVIGYAKSSTELLFDPSDDYTLVGPINYDEDIQTTVQTLNDILKTIKIINLHMSLMTDTHLEDSEVR